MQELVELRKKTEEIAANESCYLYDLEFVGTGSGRVLRVTIEKDTEGGVGIEDLSKITRALNEYLDVNEDVIPGAEYNLEVSSPGLERVLKVPAHYDRVIGKKIAVKAQSALLDFNSHLPELGLAKQIHAWLVSYDDKGLKLSNQPPEGAVDAEGNEVERAEEHDEGEPQYIFIPFDQILKAHVVFEMEDEKPKLSAKEAWEASQARKKKSDKNQSPDGSQPKGHHKK